ncbi:TPA: hypothetical protein N0F65_007893, partial [Lagenidium giganteum]
GVTWAFTAATTTMSTTARETIYVASRKSQLAMAQTNEVIAMLQKHYPNTDFVVGQQDTIGDQVLDRHLSDLGTSTASGLFTKSLEENLLQGGSSFAVHSLKDMPTLLPAGLMLGAVCKRESPEDAAIIHPRHKANGVKELKDLPAGSVIGTSSLRREALLRSQYPTFEIKTIRGNIQTRLAKLDENNEYDAIIVAACGFRRGGLKDRIDQLLPMDSFGYGVGQGSIGIECRTDDARTLEMLAKIEDERSAQMCKAERSLLFHIEGGCQIAMGVNTWLEGATLHLTATVLSRDGKESVRDSISGARFDAEKLGQTLALRFLSNEKASRLLGKGGPKRASTYGDAEAPGDAAAAAAAAAAKNHFGHSRQLVVQLLKVPSGSIGSLSRRREQQERAAAAKMKVDQLTRCQNSRVLQCFRAIGMIADDVPIAYYGMGKESFATASLGKSFVVYKCDKLTPVLVSPQLPKKILALAVLPKKHLTFTACARQVLVWKRVENVTTLKGHTANIKQLLLAGNILFSLDEAGVIKVWDTETMELVNTLNFPSGFTPSTMLHPSTYLNKILVGSDEGALQLWNVRTMKCIYSFAGWGSAVTSLEQSPAVDVVAVGLGNGKLVLHHLQLDQLVMDFHQEQSKVTAISFRTDSGAPAPFVVSGTSTGDIAVWNLESKRLESMIAQAHDGAVVSLVFLPNEPLLLSTGTDNSIKMWIFDHLTGGTARLLKSREGHKAPPTRIRYYGNNTFASMADGADGTCCQILSAGQDRAFRVFHTAREQQSTEMSQGPMVKKAKKMHVRVEDLKLPPITQFAAMETRQRDWANVLTCHENEMAAYVWRFENRAIGKKILRQFDPSDRVTPGNEEDLRRQRTLATSVAISTCGNYALVGSVGGAIFKYNMQSGEKRGSFPTAATPKQKLIRSLTLPGVTPVNPEDNSLSHAHDGPVSGVIVDALNQQVVSGGIDGKLKFWDFRKHELLFQLDIGSPISQMELHRDSNLLCVACDDQVLRLYDVSTRKLVRRFHGHVHRITDINFSSDARWLFSSSADASLRIWDIPTGKCVDWLKFHKPVTGLAVSPTGEFLATTHVGHVGIFLWANRAFFMEVFLDSEPQQPILIDMPVPVNEVDNADQLGFGSERNPQLSVDELAVNNETTSKPEPAATESTAQVEPLDASLITLSTAPRALWQSLFNLELIKKRNKPIEPPKAPEKAPFFLPTVRKDDVHPTFVPAEKTEEKKAQPQADEKTRATKEEQKNEDEEDDVQMEGWGVGDDDEDWGDDDGEGDDMDDEDDGKPKAGSVAPSKEGSRILKSVGMVTTRCKLATLLVEASEQPTIALDASVPLQRTRFHAVSAYLQTLSASAVDVEMSTICMGDFDEEGKALLGLFLTFLEEEMRTRRNFQVLQAYLNRFLKLHEQLLVQDAALLQQVDELCALQQQQWDHLQKLLRNNLCLVQYFSKIQM